MLKVIVSAMEKYSHFLERSAWLWALLFPSVAYQPAPYCHCLGSNSDENCPIVQLGGAVSPASANLRMKWSPQLLRPWLYSPGL